MPLIFFPAARAEIVFALPFAAIYSTPLLIYVGTIGPDEYVRALLLQVFWIAVFGVGALLMWRFGSRRVVVQGG